MRTPRKPIQRSSHRFVKSARFELYIGMCYNWIWRTRYYFRVPFVVSKLTWYPGLTVDQLDWLCLISRIKGFANGNAYRLPTDINPSIPSAACMRQWTGSALSSSNGYWNQRWLTVNWTPANQTWVKFESQFYKFCIRKCIWNFRLLKWRQFYPGSDELCISIGRKQGQVGIHVGCNTYWQHTNYCLISFNYRCLLPTHQGPHLPSNTITRLKSKYTLFSIVRHYVSS